MKKGISLFIIFLPFLLWGKAKIVTNYNLNRFEIYDDSRLIRFFPFERFCNYQQVSDFVYFIDTENSRIPEYGKLCCYDIAKDKLVYLPIMTGSSFAITANRAVVTTLLKSNRLNDIENIFELEDYSDYKSYPLVISVYDLKTKKLIKDFDFSIYFDDIPYESIYVNLTVAKEPDIVNFCYGIYDSTHRVLEGQIDLDTAHYRLSNKSSK